MNIFKHNLARSNRHGLSVIEVLTSIVVALIGVFGVLAMIPFSVKQTQSGLDQDTATSMARNAVTNFQASGFQFVSGSNQLNWFGDLDGPNFGSPPGQITAASSNPLMCIDPLGITSPAPSTPPATFPFNCSITGVTELSMPTINLLRPDTTPFMLADARRMFRLTDDLVFEQSEDPTVADSDVNGPQQIFNEDVSGLLNRQSTGSVSWCAIAQPIVNNAAAQTVDSYKFNVLIFKDRVTDAAATESSMQAAVVTFPTPGTVANPLSSVTIGTTLTPDVRRNDWVMLINADPNLAIPRGLATNIAFARVSNLFSNTADSTARLTLDGPNFNFTGTTYIVFLRDVVAVFPRTIKLETASAYNVGD